MSHPTKYKPKASFAKQATFSSLARYQSMHRESLKSPDKFWGRFGKEELAWFTQPKKTLEVEIALREVVCRRETECEQ